MTASNTWGLSLLVLLLGYGLIDVPRSCWYSARLQQRLARTYFGLAKMSLEKAEADETLEDVLDVRVSSTRVVGKSVRLFHRADFGF